MKDNKVKDAEKLMKEKQKRVRELIAKEKDNKKKGLPFDKALAEEIMKALDDATEAGLKALSVMADSINERKKNSKQ